MTSSEPCAVRCPWHDAAARWLAESKVDELERNLMMLYRASQSQWMACTCNLWTRVRQAVRAR